jgi:uncharacterized membrane protein YdjX (TVP38/TMEM64 family)
MKRALVLMLVLAAVVILSKLIVEDLFGLSLDSLASAWLADPGVGAAMVIVSLLAIDVFLPVPSSLVMVLSGAAFGVIAGSALALVGSVAGEWVGFELVRRYGRGVSARMMGDEEFERFRRFFERHGILAVILTRPLPIVMETMSLVAGVSGMTRWAFLAASIAGTLPIVVVYAYAGAVSREAGSIVPAAVILVAVTAAAWLWWSAAKRSATKSWATKSPATKDTKNTKTEPRPVR